jgi:transcription elongation factor GreB
VFFGASVTLRAADGAQREVTIVGIDEVDPARGRVSWISPIARALLKAREGDVVRVVAPAGVEELEIVQVEYRTID